MRAAILFFYLISCVSCSFDEQQTEVVLPPIDSNQVNLNDGIQEQEAPIIALEYFNKYISVCGIVDNLQDEDKFWQVSLKGGYGASNYGTLRLAKDASLVLFRPPNNGLPSSIKKDLENLSDKQNSY